MTKKITIEDINTIRDNKHLTINELIKMTGKGKGTISKYLSEFRTDVEKKNAYIRSPEHMKEMVAKKTAKNRKLAQNLANDVWDKNYQDPIFILGLSLYWCEGNRRSSFTFANTDQTMLQFYTRWFSKYFPFLTWVYRIHHPLKTKDVQVLIDHWTEILGKPAQYFICAKNTKKEMGVIQVESRGILHCRSEFISTLENRLKDYIDSQLK